MKPFDDLIHEYTASGLDSTTIKTWYAENSPSEETLSALAESIGAAFLADRIDFSAANGLLNQLMPLAGFESAPSSFWQYYTAFENAETTNDPGTHAKQAVSKLARAGTA